MSKSKVLYLTYDGLLEPLGQSQVWSYLKRLASKHQIYLVSFEKKEDLMDKTRMKAMRVRCQECRIYWRPMTYHKFPSLLATFYDIVLGTSVGVYLTCRFRLNIVHARSYVPAVMSIIIKSLTKTRFIFDMRGFWVDERLDSGQFTRESFIYRWLKKIEKSSLLRADAVVSLTQAAVDVMQQYDYLQKIKPKFQVIPTCADLSLFCPSLLKASPSPFVLGYVGSVGGLYLFDKVLLAFQELIKQRPDSKLLILNKNNHEYIDMSLKKSGIPLSLVEVIACQFEEVPNYLRQMHASVFFIKPTFSKKASAATKLAEILACGLPVLVNDGIGDQTNIILNDGHPVGVVVDDFIPSALAKGITQLLCLSEDESMKGICRSVAQQHFSVESGVEKYDELYAF